MTTKRDLFLNAINNLLKRKQENTGPVVEKTLKERVRDKLRELGIDRDTQYKFGGTTGLQRIFNPSFDIKFQEPEKPFNEEEQSDYISNPDNWLLVHATNYMPKNNRMQTTAMARNWSAPRATVHFTLNHVVQAHIGGNWDDRPIIILTPYHDTVQENGKPVGFSAVDTYFSPDADSGLKLPKSARIVHPGSVPDGHLFQIKNNETIYKSDNYTDDEINEILTLMTPQDRKIYDDMLSGNLQQHQITSLLEHDYSGKMKAAYESAKDKQSFLSGLMAETRYQMLTHFVRQMATHMTIERMGFREITQTFDAGKVLERAADTAYNTGIKRATASNKGHSNSIYARMEDIYAWFSILDEDIQHATTPQELQDIIDSRTRSFYGKRIFLLFAKPIIERHPISEDQIYAIFEEDFADYYKRYYEQDFGEYEGIQNFDKNLDITLKRYCKYQAKEMMKTIEHLSPEIKKLITDNYLANNNLQNISKTR